MWTRPQCLCAALGILGQPHSHPRLEVCTPHTSVHAASASLFNPAGAVREAGRAVALPLCAQAGGGGHGGAGGGARPRHGGGSAPGADSVTLHAAAMESAPSHSRLHSDARAPSAVFAGKCAQTAWCCRLRCCALGLFVCCATWLQFRGWNHQSTTMGSADSSWSFLQDGHSCGTTCSQCFAE
jgi:hypothetical protein